MALQFELNSLEGLEDSISKLYSKVGDVYRLDVEGIDKAEELKKALKKERDSRSEAEKKANALEEERKTLENKRLEEQKEYEKLWKQEQEKQTLTAKELSELKAKIAENDRDKTALEAINGLTKDTAKSDLLKDQALKFIQTTPDGTKIIGPSGDLDIGGLSKHLTETLPFLVDGSPAGGGGATGGKGKPQSENNLNLSPTERINAARAKG